VWEGHPSSLTEKTIAKALVGALPKPLFEFPASAAAVKSALLKRKYATALEEVAKLSEADGAELKKAITDLVAARVAGMNSSLKEGDFLTAQEDAAALAKELAGLPELSDASKALEDIKANKDAARVIAAQKKIRALQGQRLGKRMEYEKALADLDKIAKELEGTFAATEAKELRKEIASRKRN
jgi:multidrug resistance efflux pump